MDIERRYHLPDIEAATGIKTSTLFSRARRLGIPLKQGVTYAQVLQLIKKPQKAVRRKAPGAEALKRRLQTDGFPTAR